MSNNEHGHSEIIIIKRGNEEEEGHHGGAWKIAFADFMTAMMALFLVLWLINAANEETKRAVASYFNPVKLVDRNRSSKGVNEQSGGPTSAPNEPAKEKQASDITPPPDQKAPDQQAQAGAPNSDQTFFADPQQTIETIEQTALQQQTSMLVVPANRPNPESDSFADPFGPDFWTKADQGAQKAADGQQPDKKPAEAATKPDAPVENNAAATEEKVPPITQTTDAAEVAAIGKPPIAKPLDTFKPEEAKSGGGKSDAAKKADEALAGKLRDDVKKALEEKVKGDAEALNSTIEIKTTDEGILVSVTDTLGHPMFEIGSAVPGAPLAFAVDAIAKSLAGQAGKVHVYGHTDGREYRNVADGNWRLSTDRAKATYFMLMHGGLQDSRVVQIAGFADRKLRVPDDPLADENRRIEILLETK